MKGLDNYVPGVATIRSYRARWGRSDLLAGLALTALLVPQGMAYAELSGLPPVTGLYTTAAALVAYAVFGPSRIMVLGPDSALGPLIAAAILPLLAAGADPDRAVALAGLLALLVGVVCLAAGFARLGVLTELIAKPVRIGFLNGIALVVLVGELPKLLGFSASGKGLLGEARGFVDGVRDGQTVSASLVVGLVSLATIAVCRRISRALPGVLLAMVVAGIATAVLDLTEHGVSVIGAVPSGVPVPGLPRVGLEDVTLLLVAALGIAFVVLADTGTLSRTLAAKRGERVDGNQEMRALGAANVAAGLFQGFPVSASASRTAVADSSGSRTQLTGVIGGVGIIVVLVAAGDLGRYLPTPALAAVIIVAAWTLLDVHTMAWLWRVRRSEFLLAVAALLGVAVFGALPGIGIAVALSLGDFVRRAWRPYDAVLGRVTGRKGYHDLDRHPEAVQIPGLVIYRFDAPLFFANADTFSNRLLAAIEERDAPVQWVIVAAEPISDVDTTGADVLTELLDRLEARGVQLAFAELKGPVKDSLRSYGLLDRIGDDHLFPTIGTAVDGYVSATGAPWTDWSDESPGLP